MNIIISHPLLESIRLPNQFWHLNADSINITHVENVYNQVIQALHTAANLLIPKTNSSYYKAWWDEELKNAKQKSIAAHKNWVTSGKPRNGALRDCMTKARLEYKPLIKAKEMESNSEFSSELSDALLQKNSNQFWKSWKSKFGKKQQDAALLQGCINSAYSTDKFAEYFRGLYESNSPEKHLIFQKKI